MCRSSPMQQIEDSLAQAKITIPSLLIDFLQVCSSFPKSKRKLITLKNMYQYLCFFKEKAFAGPPFPGTLTHLDKFCSFEIMRDSSITTLERGKRKGRGKKSRRLRKEDLRSGAPSLKDSLIS